VYVEQHIVEPDGRLRIALVWIPSHGPDDKVEEELPNESVVIIDLDIDDLQNTVNFNLN
jgi:hypothetical protein